MIISAIHSSRKLESHVGEINLSEHDFHPCKPFFTENTLKPESVKKIKTKGILETTRYIRHTLKMFDYLLEVDGELYIEFYRVSFDVGGYSLRPLNYLMNEISLCYKDRFKVYRKEFRDNIDYLYLKKIKSTLPKNDKISRWSFGIVSDGRKNKRILNIIHQIRGFKIPEFEVLICGPKPSTEDLEDVIVLDDSDLYFDVRIPISKKKNKIIENARFNNLIILHDRISFPADWYESIKKHGNFFDQLAMPILDEQSQSHRINDWIKSYSDFTLFQHSRSEKIDYSEWDRHIYIDGGFMLIKKHLIEKIKLNPFLNWGEIEDVDLSERLYMDGNSISFYKNNFILTQTHRIKVPKKTRNWVVIILKPLFKLRLNFIEKRKLSKEFNYFISQSF
jgi:hypothetical protein